ncbi:MAG: hypothetical protein K0R28_6346, partial [Paenibacillus sp.]|nr:hypothetical protein [Paenibacillus sp.]
MNRIAKHPVNLQSGEAVPNASPNKETAWRNRWRRDKALYLLLVPVAIYFL